MNLCSTCLQNIGLTIRYPKLLKVTKWCDNCKSDRSSFDIISVVEQALVVKG